MVNTKRLQLILMMFLEYAVWGAWMPILSATLINRGVQPNQVGYVYGALWAACIVSPFLGGQLVDRLMPSQVFLGLSHLLAAGAAFVAAQQTDPAQITLWMFVWSLLFAPSLGITNSITFQQVEKFGGDEAQRERDFSIIRTAGTLGWIVAAVLLTVYMRFAHTDPKAITGPIPEMMLAGLVGLVMAVYSFTLPNTPPNKDKRADPLAFRRAFFLFRAVPGFTVFMAISFFAATEFQFFYLLSGQFLESKTIPHNLIPVVKSISQIAEIGALGVLLPLLLPKKGMRWCLLAGSFAWPIRYFIFRGGQSHLAGRAVAGSARLRLCVRDCGAEPLCRPRRAEGYSGQRTKPAHLHHAWTWQPARQYFRRIRTAVFHGQRANEMASGVYPSCCYDAGLRVRLLIHLPQSANY